MVNVNKLNNLLWVWNINTDPKFGYDCSALNAAWYPGDEYVDIVAVDIYDQLLNHNSAVDYYNKIVSDVGTDKIIALSENGAIPDIDSIAEDKAYWSYWMTWSQTWSGNFLDKTPTDMWCETLTTNASSLLTTCQAGIILQREFQKERLPTELALQIHSILP